jgi:hypothetical protein
MLGFHPSMVGASPYHRARRQGRCPFLALGRIEVRLAGPLPDTLCTQRTRLIPVGKRLALEIRNEHLLKPRVGTARGAETSSAAPCGRPPATGHGSAVRGEDVAVDAIRAETCAARPRRSTRRRLPFTNSRARAQRSTCGAVPRRKARSRPVNPPPASRSI